MDMINTIDQVTIPLLVSAANYLPYGQIYTLRLVCKKWNDVIDDYRIAPLPRTIKDFPEFKGVKHIYKFSYDGSVYYIAYPEGEKITIYSSELEPVRTLRYVPTMSSQIIISCSLLVNVYVEWKDRLIKIEKDIYLDNLGLMYSVTPDRNGFNIRMLSKKDRVPDTLGKRGASIDKFTELLLIENRRFPKMSHEYFILVTEDKDLLIVNIKKLRPSNIIEPESYKRKY